MISKTIGFRGTLFSDTPIYIYKKHSQSWLVNPWVQGADVGILGQDMEQRGQDPVVPRAGHQVQQQSGVGVLVPGSPRDIFMGES